MTAETNVIDTLWFVWSTLVGVMVTTVVELAFAHLRPGDNVIFPVAERLAAVEEVLRCYARGEPVNANAQRQINRFAMLGTSLARRFSTRSRIQPALRSSNRRCHLAGGNAGKYHVRASRSSLSGPTMATGNGQPSWPINLRNFALKLWLGRRPFPSPSRLWIRKPRACLCWVNWNRPSR